jgi:DNA-binding transcriptional LysR family regulator
VDRLDDLAFFTTVVDAGSLTAAAERMSISTAAVSKRLAKLEERLGVRLLHRQARGIRCTEAGIDYYDSAHEISEAVDEVEDRLRCQQVALQGQLRINMPVSYGEQVLMPLLLEFIGQHPHLHLHVDLDDALIDLHQADYDLVVRIGPLGDIDAIARRLSRQQLLLVASPTWCEKHGKPQSVEDIDPAHLLAYGRRGGTTVRFASGYAVPANGAVSSNSGEALRQAVIAGAGMSMLPSWMIQQDLEEQRLCCLLRESAQSELPVHGLYRHRRYLPRKVDALMNFLQERLPG